MIDYIELFFEGKEYRCYSPPSGLNLGTWKVREYKFKSQFGKWITVYDFNLRKALAEKLSQLTSDGAKV